MSLRAVVSLVAALSLAVAAWVAVRGGGTVVPSRDAPVTVGSVRVAAGALEAAAVRSAGARPGRLASARRAAANRAIERLWLEGEASARGLRPTAEIGVLRAQVADALVGSKPAPDAARLATVFDAFHARWRGRTRCLAAYRDAYEDRCADGAGAAAGTCRWMGAATVCAVRGGGRVVWVVVRDARSARATRAAAARVPRGLASRMSGGGHVMRFRSRANALVVAHADYVVARATRARAAAATRAAVKRAAAARAQTAERARRARERQKRARNPRLTGEALAAAQNACELQLHDSDPYMFGFGMQDVVGQAQGLLAARATLARRLPTSADAVDRRKLRPLIEAVAAGDDELVRLASARQTGDLPTIAKRTARFDARTEPERAISRRLGLGDCLARPAR